MNKILIDVVMNLLAMAVTLMGFWKIADFTTWWFALILMLGYLFLCHTAEKIVFGDDG
jgi:hypothetical protein